MAIELMGRTPIPSSSLDNTDRILIIDQNDTQVEVTTLEALNEFINPAITIDRVTGLQTALDGKANTIHTHQITDVEGLDFELSLKYDANNANIEGNTINLGTNSLNVLDLIQNQIESITGVSPRDGRIPDSTTIGQYVRFVDANGGLEGRSVPEIKSDLSISNVDDTSDLNKPVSTATQAALDLKQDVSTAFSGDYNDLTNQPTIPADMSAAIALNTGKRTYPQADETKLSGIETGADVTDTVNVWSALGISTTGATNQVLTQRGVFVPLTTVQLPSAPDADASRAVQYNLQVGTAGTLSWEEDVGLLTTANTWTGVNTFNPGATSVGTFSPNSDVTDNANLIINDAASTTAIQAGDYFTHAGTTHFVISNNPISTFSFLRVTPNVTVTTADSLEFFTPSNVNAIVMDASATIQVPRPPTAPDQIANMAYVDGLPSRTNTFTENQFFESGVRVGGNSAANQLDDYEEGTWTPSPDNASSFTEFESITARYTKIGNLVKCWAEFTIPSTATANQNIQITGLPFTESHRASTGGTATLRNTIPANVYRQTNTGEVALVGVANVGNQGLARYSEQAGQVIRMEFTIETND